VERERTGELTQVNDVCNCGVGVIGQQGNNFGKQFIDNRQLAKQGTINQEANHAGDRGAQAAVERFGEDIFDLVKEGVIDPGVGLAE
jgi:hypothetical protein